MPMTRSAAARLNKQTKDKDSNNFNQEIKKTSNTMKMPKNNSNKKRPRKKKEIPVSELKNITNVVESFAGSRTEIRDEESDNENEPLAKRNKQQLVDKSNNNSNQQNKNSVINTIKDQEVVLPSKSSYSPAASLVKESKIVVIQKNSIASSTPSALSSSSSSNEASVAKKQFIELKNILNLNYLDIIRRLKLKCVPKCVENFEYCKKNHSKSCKKPKMATAYIKSKKNHLIEENRVSMFIKIVDDMISRNEFWGAEIFTTIFELILTINASEELLYTTDYIINECVTLFDKLLITFPPCYESVRSEYESLLTSKIQTDKILPEKTISEMPNIFVFIISQISETITEDDDLLESNKDYTENSAFFNFNEWESRHSVKKSLNSHNRQEKLNRLYLVLHLLTKLLEMDLAVWMLKYYSKPLKHIYSSDKPLIVSVFDLSHYNQLTDTVKKMIQLFVTCISNDYPEDVITILSRQISLLATVVNLSDTSSSANGILYPVIGQRTEIFTREIFKIIEGTVGTNVKKYSNIIDKVEMPFIKYNLVDLFLNKINPHKGKMCLQKIFEKFSHWNDYSPLSSLHSKEIERSESNIAKNKYPFVKRLKQTKCEELCQEDYLKLLLVATKSYCEFNSIQSYAMILMSRKPIYPQPNISNDVMIKSEDKTSNGIKINYDKVEKDLDKLLKQINYSEKIATDKCFAINCLVNVHMNTESMLMYRQDVAAMMKLNEIIPKIKKISQNTMLEEWNNYLKDFFLIN